MYKTLSLSNLILTLGLIGVNINRKQLSIFLKDCLLPHEKFYLFLCNGRNYPTYTKEYVIFFGQQRKETPFFLQLFPPCWLQNDQTVLHWAARSGAVPVILAGVTKGLTWHINAKSKVSKPRPV